MIGTDFDDRMRRSLTQQLTVTLLAIDANQRDLVVGLLTSALEMAQMWKGDVDALADTTPKNGEE